MTFFEFIDFFSANKKEISGIILSNSCDIDINNKRYIAPKINISPIV
jgi:hypothetical protein